MNLLCLVVCKRKKEKIFIFIFPLDASYDRNQNKVGELTESKILIAYWECGRRNNWEMIESYLLLTNWTSERKESVRLSLIQLSSNWYKAYKTWSVRLHLIQVSALLLCGCHFYCLYEVMDCFLEDLKYLCCECVYC